MRGVLWLELQPVKLCGMDPHMKRTALLVVFSLSIACSGAELTEAGQHVTFTDSALDVSGCEQVGVVESQGASPHDAHARTAAIHELRNAAAGKGGTHVFVDSEKAPDLARGLAYKCP